ncbi:hypothetical protein IJJ27_00650 [bacterium]|nr:hypothetical protein [bacterium]
MAVHTQNRRSSNHDKHTASHGSGKKTCGDCRGKGQVRNYSRPNGGKNYTMEKCSTCGGRGKVSKGKK